MGTVQEKDIAIWVCPEGSSSDVKEFSAGGKEPEVRACRSHGKPFYKRCPSTNCPHPTYHWSDLDAQFHEPCGTRIPWATMRSETARVLMEHDDYHSALIGRSLPEEAKEEHLTPPVTPPPGSMYRRPSEVGMDLLKAYMEGTTEVPEKKPPRVTGPRTTGSDLEAVQREVDAWRASQRKSQQVWQAPPLPKIVKPQRSKWEHFIAGAWSLLFNSLASFIGGLALLLFVIWLAYQGIRLVVP